MSGFLYYSTYSTGGFIFPYQGTGTVKVNDLFFAWHAFALASIQLSQAFIFDRGVQKHFKLWALILLVFEWLSLIGLFVYESFILDPKNPLDQSITTFRYAGYCKALISLVKYLP